MQPKRLLSTNDYFRGISDMHEPRGFVRWNERRQRFEVDWRKTLSIVTGELLLQEILAARSYIKGYLLDVGCGSRPYAIIYTPLVELSIGTEVSYSPHGARAADAIAPAECLPFADQTFDVILCTEVLEHIWEPTKAMREFARVLKPDGYLLLSVPFIHPIHEAPHDNWRFTSYGLKFLCHSTGFEVIYLNKKGGVVTTGIVLSLNLVVRGVNAVSKLLRLSVPLRDRTVVRWILALPQRIYLFVRSSPVMAAVRKAVFGQLDNFLTPGYFLVARRKTSFINSSSTTSTNPAILEAFKDETLST